MLFKRQDSDFNSSLVTGPEIRSKIRRTVPASSGADRNTRVHSRWTSVNYDFGGQNYGFAALMGGSFPEFRSACSSPLSLSLSLFFSVFFLPSFRAVSSSPPALLPPFLTTLSGSYLVPLLFLPFPTRNGPFVSQRRKIIDVKKEAPEKMGPSFATKQKTLRSGISMMYTV